MSETELDSLSLLPISSSMREVFAEHSRRNLEIADLIAFMFASISGILNLACMLNEIIKGDPYTELGIAALADLARMLFYIGLYFAGKKYLTIQIIGTWLVPVIFSLTVTEISIYRGFNEKTVPRILSISCILLIYPTFIPIHFFLSVIPVAIGLVYPIFRTCSFSSNSILLVFNSLLGFILCAYQMRKIFVTELCQYYKMLLTGKHWEDALCSLPIGISIVSLFDGKFLFLNNALLKIMESQQVGTPRNGFSDNDIGTESLQQTPTQEAIYSKLVQLPVKKITNQNGQSSQTLNFIEFINDKQDDKKVNYFLENANKLIEVRVCDVLYGDMKRRLISFVDASTVQYLEQLQAESKYKTMLISTVSHELRTPINAVLNSIELIKPFVPPSKLRLIQIAEDSCNLILFHVNDFTDYGKLNNRDIVINSSLVNVKKIVEFCLELIKYNAEQKGITLKLEEIPDMNHEICADERRLKQVVINLLNNAVKFTMEGSITISLKYKLLLGETMYTIKVRDTGMGIAQEDISKLCNEFTMLDTHSAVNPNGTGLGLYLCRRIARLMGGDILIKSVLNKGSAFSVVLPVANFPQEECKHFLHSRRHAIEFSQQSIVSCDPIPSSSAPPTKSNKFSALIVDDDAMNIFVFESLLKRLGVKCDKAGNGKEALDIVSQKKTEEQYKIIFMDVNMPIMNGCEAGQKLKKLMAKGRVPFIPIIALTGDDTNIMEQKQWKLSFDFLLAKPISIDKLSKILEIYS